MLGCLRVVTSAALAANAPAPRPPVATPFGAYLPASGCWAAVRNFCTSSEKPEVASATDGSSSGNERQQRDACDEGR